MSSVLRSSWPLLLGIMLLLVGNGMQGTLLGIRGGYENISTDHMAVVMAGYFAGFLLGSRLAPGMIQRVGHVRVFAALGSLISAVLVLYPAVPHWIAWTLLRVLIGFCFSGVYITAESWLNASTTNENRGKAMSAYLIVQMIGLVSAQFLINFGDPRGFLLFVVPSVLVSLAFTPILLSAQPAPAFGALKRMSFRRLYQVSPLGCFGVFLMGGIFSAMLGMTSVWGTILKMSVRDISAIVAAIYLGGLVAQFPIGWLSDRMDRRRLILYLLLFGTAAIAAQLLLSPGIWGMLLVAAISGGVANPVYALLLAHTNDYLDADDMAAASAGLLFLNGLGAIGGPLIVGRLMSTIGPDGFWAFIGTLMAILAAYTAWRMTRREGLAPAETGGLAAIAPAASAVAVELALEAAQDEGGHTQGPAPDDLAPADYAAPPAPERPGES
ncbi:MAG: MFS transporter [Paracoccus sp. (in: a-proteobacteria)]|nr:MFS transporter [Paracoccus sp. (in: a-proteobacteria)]